MVQINNDDFQTLIKTYENIAKELTSEVETLTSQLDTAHTKEARLTLLVKILADAFKRQTHLPNAVAAIEWSKEAKEKSYYELKILETLLENIEKGVTGYED